MGKKTVRTFQIDGILSLLLFGVFASCLLLVLFGGTQAYSRIVRRDDAVYTQRTAAQYFARKLHGAPMADGVSVTQINGGDALVIRQQLEGETYVTLIYCYDGWLRELFTKEKYAAEADPSCGEKLLEVAELELEKDHGLVQITFSAAGRSSTLQVTLRGEEEAAE